MVRPAFILEGQVTIQYNLGPTFDSENTTFPVFKLCQALSVPKPIPEVCLDAKTVLTKSVESSFTEFIKRRES